MPFINGQWVDEEELMALQASMIPTVGGYDRGPDAGWGLTNMGGIYGTEPVVGGEGVTPGYNPGLDASIINESMQSQAPVNTIQVPFSQASQTSSITPFASPRYTSYDKGPGWDTSAISLQSAFNPTPQEDVSYWQAPKTEAPVPQVPQRQEVAPQVQAPAPFVAPTYVAPAAPAPVDVEAIRSTVTAPAPFDFSDVSRGRLAKAREYAGQGMFGRAKQQIERGGGEWSKAMHRALRGETGMSAADLAKAKDAAVQQATRAREAQHAANVSAAQKKHAANVKAAKAKHAENVRVAALTRQATARQAAARQAVIDAQRAAAAAAQQSVIDAQMAAARQQQDVATVAPFTGTDSVFTGDEVNVAFGGKRNPGGGYTVGGGGDVPWGEAFLRMLGAPIDEPGQIGGRLGLGLGTAAAIAAAIAMANRDKAAAAQAAFEASLDDDAMRAWNNMTEEQKAAASTGYGEGGGFMGADIGHDEGGYTGGDFSSGEGWE